MWVLNSYGAGGGEGLFPGRAKQADGLRGHGVSGISQWVRESEGERGTERSTDR